MTFEDRIEKIRKQAPVDARRQLNLYLQSAFRMLVSLASSKKRRIRFRQLCQNADVKKTSLARQIVEMTAGSHVSPKTRWKWALALETALKSSVAPEDFRKFLKKAGGIKGLIGQ